MPDFAYGPGPPRPVPPMKPEKLADGVTLVRPLSRRGEGPGLILLVAACSPSGGGDLRGGIPSRRMKWAEEGYVVVEIVGEEAFSSSFSCSSSSSSSSSSSFSSPLQLAVAKLDECKECEPKEKIGLVCYDTEMWSKSASALQTLRHRIVVSAIYATALEYPSISSSQASSIPTIYHLTSGDASSSSSSSETTTTTTTDSQSKIYKYGNNNASSSSFAIPFHKHFHYATEAISHSRNLAFLKKHMDGPVFDLEQLWEEHTFYEFGDRSVENTMATMVEEPYVNHVPTLTGGIGRVALTAFYTHHFIFSNPHDAELELISRTVGIDRVVDEFVYKCTHDRRVDWLFPGVPATHRSLQIPMMAVVNFRGDRLYHEHITWDQGTALRQIGLLPERLPLVVDDEVDEEVEEVVVDADADDGNGSSSLKKKKMKKKKKKKTKREFDVVLPVAGIDSAAKIRDKNSVDSNHMFRFEAREV